jgi:glycosyltransferase involved in cell wall biosynthesis
MAALPEQTLSVPGQTLPERTSPADAPEDFRACAVIPTYDNPQTIASVVERVKAHLEDVIVVDDGSGPEAKEVLAEIASSGAAILVTREANGGKGAAVKTGLGKAAELGYSHALQVDADGQHTLGDIPRLLAMAARHPTALVLGAPEYDASAPRARRIGRRITRFWIRVETGGDHIADAMCGFRVYPVRAALAARARGDAMDFDPEIAVRMVWRGAPVINVPTKVRYLDSAEGGVSHFRLFWDNVFISRMHTGLMLERIFAPLFRLVLPRGR